MLGVHPVEPKPGFGRTRRLSDSLFSLGWTGSKICGDYSLVVTWEDVWRGCNSAGVIKE